VAFPKIKLIEFVAPSKKKQNWPNEITNTCINWYNIKDSEIYRKNKGGWHPVSLTKKFPGHFGVIQSSYHHICVVLSPDIALYLLVFIHTSWRLGTFVLLFHWMCSLRCQRWRKNRMRSENIRVLGHVIWLVVKEICELWTRLCKLELGLNIMFMGPCILVILII